MYTDLKIFEMYKLSMLQQDHAEVMRGETKTCWGRGMDGIAVEHDLLARRWHKFYNLSKRLDKEMQKRLS